MHAACCGVKWLLPMLAYSEQEIASDIICVIDNYAHSLALRYVSKIGGNKLKGSVLILYFIQNPI